MRGHGGLFGTWLSSVVALMVSFSGMAAAADGDAKPAVDKSQYTLFNPTPDADLRAFSPDRPTKISSPFTVDAGHVQVESDFANYSHANFGGMTTKTVEALDPTFKLGVVDTVDLEMTLNGYQSVRQSTNGVAGSAMRVTGFGDVLFKAKINLLGNGGGDYTFAVIPYVKVPSSSPASLAIGNGVVEGGGLAILQIALPQDFTLILQTEGDALKGGNDTRRHANFVNIVNIGHAVPGIKDLTANAEIYTSVSTDRFTPDLYTADFALAYLVTPTLQLDVGTNIGLNAAAPKYQVYAGIARRF